MTTREQEITSRVTGFLVPIFQQQLPNGRMCHGLSEWDYERVKAGYACADCLAIFDMYTLKCPLCGLSRNLADDIMAPPPMWVDAIRDHNEDRTPYTQPAPNPLAEGTSLSKEIETIPVNKLKPSKHGRGA